MYFVYRDGDYIDVAGRVVPRLHGRPRARTSPARWPTVGDFADHMTTVFTDVRMKRFLEMRGADAGRPDMMVAQSAFWVGLLYDDAAPRRRRGAAARRDLAGCCGVARARCRAGADAAGAAARLRDLAREALAIARRRPARTGVVATLPGATNSIHLAPLEDIAGGGPTQAEHWLERYHRVWQRRRAAHLR